MVVLVTGAASGIGPPAVKRFACEGGSVVWPRTYLLRTTRKGTKHGPPAQITQAWLLAHKPWIVPNHGTTNFQGLNENSGAAAMKLTPAHLRKSDHAASRAGCKWLDIPRSWSK